VDGPNRPDAAPPDAAASDAASPDAAAPDATLVTTLSLTLDDTLDGDGDAKATSIATADLLDETGALVAHATIAAGAAVFTLTRVAAGDYFVEVNGDADDLVPTRIDASASTVLQRVGQKLRASLIGPVEKPTYRINTYSSGQGESPAVKYSDGTPVSDEQPYILITLPTWKVEFKALGTARALGSVNITGGGHLGNGVPFDAWILNTEGQPHHGDAFNDDSAGCPVCHTDMTTKPVFWSSAQPASGWCYRCHYGEGGDSSGFVDPTK